jgi:hypothetical protein
VVRTDLNKWLETINCSRIPSYGTKSTTSTTSDRSKTSRSDTGQWRHLWSGSATTCHERIRQNRLKTMKCTRIPSYGTKSTASTTSDRPKVSRTDTGRWRHLWSEAGTTCCEPVPKCCQRCAALVWPVITHKEGKTRRKRKGGKGGVVASFSGSVPPPPLVASRTRTAPPVPSLNSGRWSRKTTVFPYIVRARPVGESEMGPDKQ